MRVKKVAVISMAVVLCLVALALGVWHFLPHSVQIAADGASGYRICAKGDSPQLQAAAAYLSRQIFEQTGAMLPVDPEAKEDTPYILLRLESGAGASYALDLDDAQNLVFHLYDGEHAFETVKTVCDAWLREGVGLRDGALGVSPALIRRELEQLPVSLDTSGEFRVLTLSESAASGDGLDALMQLISELQPDFISTQKLSAARMDSIQQLYSPHYYIMGINAYASPEEGEAWNAVLFRRDRFRFVDGDSFWLSDTPHLAGSRLEGAEAPGLCTWVLLRDLAEGGNVFISNSSLSSGSSAEAEALRARELDILIETLRADSGCFDLEPGFLTGGLFLRGGEAAYSGATSVCSDAAAGADAAASADGTTLPACCLYTQDRVTILEARKTDALPGLFVRALPF